MVPTSWWASLIEASGELERQGTQVTGQVSTELGKHAQRVPLREVLSDFGVPYECTIVSAHRTPARMYEYAQSAANRGLKAQRRWGCDVDATWLRCVMCGLLSAATCGVRMRVCMVPSFFLR